MITFALILHLCLGNACQAYVVDYDLTDVDCHLLALAAGDLAQCVVWED